MAVAAHEIQGSQEWLEYRRTRGGASEVAALFECSPFMPKNAFELYQVKTGEREVFVNDAMRHGTRNEPAARAKLEDILGESLEPQVLEDNVNERIVASLDGQTIDGKTIVEIKCPPKGKASKAWKEVEDNGKPGYHYYLQIQQQLLCSGAEYCLFAVYDAADDEVITTQVNADPAIQDEIRTKWAAFFEALDAGAPPEHGHRRITHRLSFPCDPTAMSTDAEVDAPTLDDPGALLRRLHRQTQTGPSVNTSFLQQVREVTQDRIAQAEKQARRVVSDIRTIVSYHGGVPRRQEAIVGGFYMHAPVDTDKEGFARIARVGASDLEEVELDAIDDWLLRYECGDLHEFSPGDWMEEFYQLAQETKAKAERKEMQNELRRIADRAEQIEPAKGGPYAKEDLPF